MKSEGMVKSQDRLPQALNGKVACSEFPSLSVETEIKGGMLVPKQRGSMTQLTVVFDSGKQYGGPWFPKGTKIWVRADCFKLAWARDVLDLNGQKFVLVPEDQILFRQW